MDRILAILEFASRVYSFRKAGIHNGISIQELCWALADENFPSLETGQEFVSWCSHQDVDVLMLKDHERIISLFREFVRERRNKILKIKVKT